MTKKSERDAEIERAQREEREAIQKESEAPPGAENFPFGHNKDKDEPSAQKPKARRQRGSGSLFKKPPNKNWFVQNGRRIRESTGSPDLDGAKKLLRQRLHEIDQSRYVARVGRAARVKDLYETLKLERDARGGRKRELPNRWAHLEPAFGGLVASEISTDDIRRYTRARQEKGAANATINRELATLKRMFRLAMQGTPPRVLRVPYIPMLREADARSGFLEDAAFSRLTGQATELWLRTFLELASLLSKFAG
jgi:hypothetical protein